METTKKAKMSVNVFVQWRNDLNVNIKGKGAVMQPAGTAADGSSDEVKSHFLKQAWSIDTIPKNFKPWFVADQDGNINDINNCMDLLEQEFRNIKNLYLYISTSEGDNFSRGQEIYYPYISRERIKDFCVEIDIIEGTKADDDLKLKSSSTMIEEPSSKGSMARPK